MRATRAGAIACALLLIRMVYPSGAALATRSVPISPPAPPVRFSTAIGWPSSAEACSVASRAIRSASPAGEVVPPKPLHRRPRQAVALRVLGVGGRAGAVPVGHGIQQHLPAQRRPALVPHPQRRDRGEVAARAVAAHDDARRVRAERRG